MPDITVCDNRECPMFKKCFRGQVKWNNYQSVSTFEPNEDGTCDHFWELEKDADN
jgi:hypothetical protein